SQSVLPSGSSEAKCY
ncbi:transposase IS66 family protein, partial [Escherichia coli 88.0221]